MRRLGLIGGAGSALAVVSLLASTFVATAVPHALAHGAHKSKARCTKRVKAHGTIKYSDWEFPDTMNPYQTSEAVTFTTTGHMFSSLFVQNDRLKLLPNMASVVPTIKNHLIKNGGKTIVIELKHGMKWSNGTEITSKDLKFGWQVDMDKLTGPACSGTCDSISRIDTPNKYMAVLHYKVVYAAALTNGMPDIWPTKWPGLWSGNAHTAAMALENPKVNFEDSSYPTDGPYQLSNFVLNDRITLHPMKYYDIKSCGGGIQNLIFAFYSSKEDMIAAAANRSTDITGDYTPGDIKELKSHSGSFKTYSVPGFLFEHLELNEDPTVNGQPNYLGNTNLRLALALALDRIGMTESALGITRKQAASIVAWTPWVNVPGLTQPYADKSVNGQWDPLQKKYVIPGTAKAIADAKKLIATTPCKSGCTLSFYTTSGNPTRAAQEAVIAENWKKIGVNVVPNFVPASKLFGDWTAGGINRHGTFQVSMFAFVGGVDPDGLKYTMQSKYVEREQAVKASIDSNYSAIHDKVIDKAFNIAAHTFNKKLRQKEYALVQEEMNKKSYWINLFFRPQVTTSDGKVTPYKPGPLGDGWNDYQWKVAGTK